MRRAEAALGLALAALLALLPAVARPQDGDEARRRLQATEQALRRSEVERAETERARAAARTQLAEVREQLRAAAAELRREERDAAATEARLGRLKADETARLAALKLERRELARALALLGRLARHGPSGLAASAARPLDAYRGLRLTAAASETLIARTERLKLELAELSRLRHEIGAEQERRRARLAEMDERRRQLALLLEARRSLELELADEAMAAARRAESLAGEARDLRELVASLAETEARRRAAARAEDAVARLAEPTPAPAAAPPEAAAGPPLPGRKPSLEGTVVVSAVAELRLPAPALFSQARGTLAPPALGEVVASFGQRDDLGQLSRGISIETAPLAQVMAPFDGEIVFAGQFRGYGLLLIISLGEGYHMLLAGMSRQFGVVGQQVLAGEPIGEMGTIEAGRPRLYVELRRRGEPIDPLPWMSAAKGNISG